jgi:hypothetical protein
MAKEGKFKSPFPGDNKSCYSNDGVGPYSRSYPSFSDEDGLRSSMSGDGDESYGGGGSEPMGETFPTKVGRGFAGKPHLGSKMPGGGGLPPPYGHKGRR